MSGCMPAHARRNLLVLASFQPENRRRSSVKNKQSQVAGKDKHIMFLFVTLHSCNKEMAMRESIDPEAHSPFARSAAKNMPDVSWLQEAHS